MGEKILINPVTRIEGHARVAIYLDGEGNVEKTVMHVDQFRGFEKYTEGRMFYEMPVITPRICGICPVSHHLASVKACDAIIGATVPRPAKLLRELMHMGQIIQSHSMHFFELAGPDLLLGWDADPKIRNVVGLIQANPQLVLKAVELRKFGQQIIALLGGRRINPLFAVPGGVNRGLDINRRDEMLKDIDRMIGYLEEGIVLAKGYIEKNKLQCLQFAAFPSSYLGLVGPHGELEAYDGTLRLIDAAGTRIKEFPGSDYLNYIGERVEDWSWLKWPYYKPLGWPRGSYRVGPLARLNVADKVATPKAGRYFAEWKSIGNGKPVEGSLFYHFARLVEAIYGLERARQILEDPEALSGDVLAPGVPTCERGVGVIEAPRGTLIHDYHVDADGAITRVNLIVATGHNNWAMSKAVDEVAKCYVDGKHLTEGMLNRVEGAIRCYDPCLSCSTHAVGKMPLLVELYDHDGTFLERIQRDGA